MPPVQMGIPGGPELLVALLIFVLPIVAIVYLLARSGGGSDRLDEMERRIGRLEARVDRLEEDSDDGGGD